MRFYKTITAQVEIDLTPNEVKSVVKDLPIEDQLYILACICNKWRIADFINLKPSELATVRQFLKTMLNEIPETHE
jgi:hypothetical protein